MSGFQEPSIELIHTVKACVADASYPFAGGEIEQSSEQTSAAGLSKIKMGRYTMST